MKRERNRLVQKCYHVGSILLVTLFMSISVIQAFHSHSKVVHVEQCSDHEQLAALDHCLVCDYLVHKQGKEFYLPHPPVALKLAVQTISSRPNVFVGNYKFTLQGFTNKGPPAVLA